MELSKEQKKRIKDYIDAFLNDVIRDSHDRAEVVDAMYDDVCQDIIETADWSDFSEEEYCPGDIDIAIARVLKSKICGE